MDPSNSGEVSDEGLPSPSPLDPDAPSSSGIRRSLFPPLWQRFQAHLQDPSKRPPATGAHVTLADLEKLAELREAASAPYFAEPPPLERVDGKIAGWVGVPDPSKYAPGTNTLNADEVEQEVAKGNIVMLDDWVTEISNLELWEKRALFEAMLTDWMQHRFFVHTENGKKVSFWDLYSYVHHNPELKALVESRRKGIALAASTSGEASGSQGGLAPGLYSDPGPGMWKELDLESARQMPWGLAGTGQVWSRRPTRWLWGADAQLDLDFALYVHEDQAHEILGPRYAGKDPRLVLKDERYAQDIMRAGPLMGMTFMLTAARELPARETTDAWVSRLATRLQRRALSQAVPLPLASSSSTATSSSKASSADPKTSTSTSSSGAGVLPVEALSTSGSGYEESMEALFKVYGMLDPERLAEDTKMLDLQGRNFRQGTTIVATTGPQGKIVLQATSPGLAREREGYLLGAVEDEGLAAALVEEFLGTDSVDPSFAASVPTNMLMFANGFKTDNTNQHPHMRRLDAGPAYRTEVIAASPNAFRLPRVGARQETGEALPLLLSGVQDRALVGALSDVLQQAWDAAGSVQPSASAEGQAADDAAVYEVRKEAARAALEKGLSSLGLNVQGLSFDEMQGELQPWTQDELSALATLSKPDGEERKPNLRRAVPRLAAAR